MRFRLNNGEMRTDWLVEFFGWCGWECLYHHRYVSYRDKKDAEEYVRIYKSLKK